jgi:tetratricopeptide (TPR) repeat protein
MLRSWKTISTISLGVALLAGCSKDLLRDPLARQKYLAEEQANMKDAPLAEMPDILPQTYFAAGSLFASQGQVAKAIEQYRKAIAVHHHFAAAYHRLGRMLSIADQHDEAVQALAKAVELKPNIAMLRNDYGYELMHLGRWAESEEQFRKAIATDPKLARAYINLGLVLGRTERFAEALDAFSTVLPDTDAHYNLGLLYRGQKRYAEAAEEFRQVLELDPQFPAARIQLDQLAVHLESNAMRQRQSAMADAAATSDAPSIVAQQDQGPQHDTAVESAPALPMEATAERLTHSRMEPGIAPRLRERILRLPGEELAENLAADVEEEVKKLRNDAVPATSEAHLTNQAAGAFDPQWLRQELDATYSDRNNRLTDASPASDELFPARLVRTDVGPDESASSSRETSSVSPVAYRTDLESNDVQPEAADWRAGFRALETLLGVVSNEIACLDGVRASPERIAVNAEGRSTPGTSDAAPSIFASPVSAESP